MSTWKLGKKAVEVDPERFVSEFSFLPPMSGKTGCCDSVGY